MSKENMGRTRNEILMGGFNAVCEYFTEEKDFQLIAENKLDFILLSYLHDEKSEYNLKMCEKYGIKAFLYDTTINGTDSRALTDELIRTASAPYINSPAFLGFGIIDEPSDEKFPSLGREVDAIKRVYPDALFHINLLPWYAFNDDRIFRRYLNGFVNYCEINHVSTDDYPLWRDPEKDTYSTSPTYYHGLNMSACTARDAGREHWQYIYSFSKTWERGYRVYTLDDLNFQAYSHLAFGASKLLYFCWDVTGYKGEPKFGDDLPYTMRTYGRGVTELYDYSTDLNDRMHALSDTFRRYTWKQANAVLCDGKNEAFLTALDTYDNSRMTGIRSNVGLLLGTFDETDGDGFAFMMTNASEIKDCTTAEVSFKVPGAKTLTAHLDYDHTALTPDKDGTYHLTIPQGKGVFLTATR